MMKIWSCDNTGICILLLYKYVWRAAQGMQAGGGGGFDDGTAVGCVIQIKKICLQSIKQMVFPLFPLKKWTL
jgi:hypothetical protein